MEPGKIVASSRKGRDARDLEESRHGAEPAALAMAGPVNHPNPLCKCSRQELEGALSVIEGKWKALIICELMTRNLRYHELEKSIGYISRRILTYELRFLERKGIVQRFSAGTGLRGIEYSLTTRGRGLNGVLLELASWGRRVDTT